MVLVPPCHLSSRRESPPSCRKKKVKGMRDPCSQLVGFLVIRSSLFIPPCPPAPVHTLDIKSSSGTTVFVFLLLLSFFVCSAYERRSCCSSFFSKIDLCAKSLASEATSLPYSLNLSLYTSSARILPCESNNMRATAILLTALVAILPAMGEDSKQIFGHDDPIYGGT